MTAASPAQRHRTPPLGRTGTFVRGRVRQLQKSYLADHASAVAALAQLRRGAGKRLQDVPEVWGLTCDETFIPEGTLLEDGPSPQERAVHIALTLYALHQQSRSEPMHQEGHGLGAAVRQLVSGPDVDDPMRVRLVQVGSAHHIDALAVRLRELVSRLRTDGVPLDYGLLADQLVRAQRPGGMAEVRQVWGRGFHAHRAKAYSGEDDDGAEPGPPGDAPPPTDA